MIFDFFCGFRSFLFFRGFSVLSFCLPLLFFVLFWSIFRCALYVGYPNQFSTGKTQHKNIFSCILDLPQFHFCIFSLSVSLLSDFFVFGTRYNVVFSVSRSNKSRVVATCGCLRIKESNTSAKWNTTRAFTVADDSCFCCPS